MSRILWLSNPMWAGSGYGEQTSLFVPRLAALGHHMAVACNFGLSGVKQEYEGILHYPTDNDWGNRTINLYADHHKADRVIALCDSWVMKPAQWSDVKMAIWAPVDHEPLPAACQLVLQTPNVFPIAMSRFGERMMRNVGLDPAYVPHGVDTELFAPQPENKAAIRAELGIPADAFLIGMVAANKGNPSQSRKSFPQAFHAFSRFAKEHPDAWMYVHSEANPSPGGGISLEILAHATGCPPDRLRCTPESAWALGVGSEVVANMYAAFDVLLSPSMGEGFGIPILEAQACGVPVIATDCTAMTELTSAGWLVGGDPWWDALQAAFWTAPAIDSIVAALDASYEDRDNEDLAKAAREFALTYDADLVAVKYWEPALERILGDWSAAREVPPLNGGLNREQRRKLAKKKVSA